MFCEVWLTTAFPAGWACTRAAKLSKSSHHASADKSGDSWTAGEGTDQLPFDESQKAVASEESTGLLSSDDREEPLKELENIIKVPPPFFRSSPPRIHLDLTFSRCRRWIL